MINVNFYGFIFLQIVSWGKTETGISSPILLEASLPYIDHGSCRNICEKGFEAFILTDDKFCALGNKIFKH